MISFIHTADLHFGVENYGRVDSITGIHSRLLDFNRAFSFVISTAIEKQVDFFLFCGDAYKTANPTPTQQRLLIENLLRLYQASIPVVLIVGNHDLPGSFGKSNALDIFAHLPIEGFHVIAKPTLLPLQTQHGTIQIIGIPWPSRNTISLNKNFNTSSSQTTTIISDSITAIIAKLHTQRDHNLPTILAGHLTASTGLFSGSEKSATTGQDPLILPSQLALPGIQYAALGHLHRYQQINPNKTPPVVYSGSIERIDFGEARDTKGFCLVTLENENTNVEFIPTPTRPFIEITVTLTVDKDPTEQIIQQIQKYDIQDAVLKLYYILPSEATTPIQMRAIQAACSTAHYIAGIIPIIPKKPKSTRSTIATSVSIPEALEQFLKLQNIADLKTQRIQKKLNQIVAITEEKIDITTIMAQFELSEKQPTRVPLPPQHQDFPPPQKSPLDQSYM